MKDAEAALLIQDNDRALRIFLYAAAKFPRDLRAAIGVVRVYFANNQMEKAFKQCNALSLKYPLAAEPYAMLGNLYLSQGKIKQASEQLKNAIELEPADSESLFRLAQINLMQNSKQEAIELLKRSLLSDSQNIAVRVMYARLLRDRGDSDAAMIELDGALAQEPNNADLLYQKAQWLAEKGRNPEAIEKLLQAHRINPDSAEIQKLFVTIYGSRQDWPNGQDAALSWTQLEPKNPDSHLILGWCALMNREFDEALASLKEAVRLSPESADLHNMYGIALLERRKLDEAIVQFNAAISIRPDFLAAYLNVAATHGFKGQYEAGIEQLNKLALSYPDSLSIESLHAYLAAKAGMTDAAETFSKLTLSKEPQDVLALITSGIVFRQKNKLVESASVLQRCCKLAPESGLALCELSATYLAQEKGKDAVEMAQLALQLSPNNLDYKAALALALMQLKNYDGAIFLLKECTVRNPKDLFLRITLAEAQIAKGENEIAALTLDKARTQFPDRAEPLIGLAQVALINHNFQLAENLLEQALICAPQDQQILIKLAKAYADDGKPEECLQQLRTLNDSDMKPDDILLKARCEYISRDFASACVDYSKVINIDKLINSNDILNLARSLLETGQPARAKEMLNRIEANVQLLRQCKHAEIDKLHSDLKHALVKLSN